MLHNDNVLAPGFNLPLQHLDSRHHLPLAALSFIWLDTGLHPPRSPGGFADNYGLDKSGCL